MDYKLYRRRFFRHLFCLPFIYMMALPFILLDLMIEIYHRICFPLYGYPLIKRENYIKMDRHNLSYLRWWDKINCIYCAYANGLAQYTSHIAGETERYWCGIKHQGAPGYHQPEHHKDFIDYGDEKSFNEKFCKLKK
jgi:hypothetical protein